VSVGVCYTAVDAAAGGLTTGWWAVVLECFSSHPLLEETEGKRQSGGAERCMVQTDSRNMVKKMSDPPPPISEEGPPRASPAVHTIPTVYACMGRP